MECITIHRTPSHRSTPSPTLGTPKHGMHHHPSDTFSPFHSFTHPGYSNRPLALQFSLSATSLDPAIYLAAHTEFHSPRTSPGHSVICHILDPAIYLSAHTRNFILPELLRAIPSSLPSSPGSKPSCLLWARRYFATRIFKDQPMGKPDVFCLLAPLLLHSLQSSLSSFWTNAGQFLNNPRRSKPIPSC